MRFTIHTAAAVFLLVCGPAHAEYGCIDTNVGVVCADLADIQETIRQSLITPPPVAQRDETEERWRERQQDNATLLGIVRRWDMEDQLSRQQGQIDELRSRLGLH